MSVLAVETVLYLRPSCRNTLPSSYTRYHVPSTFADSYVLPPRSPEVQVGETFSRTASGSASRIPTSVASTLLSASA